jgi:hypothetical protein
MCGRSRHVGQIQAALHDPYSMSMLLGAVNSLWLKTGKIGGERVDGVHECGQHVPVVHVGGTAFLQGNANGRHEATRQMWLGAAVTSRAVACRATLRRGAMVARRLLGQAFTGMAVLNRSDGEAHR